MAEELSIAETFAVDLQWPANPGKGGDSLLDGSLARFQVLVGDKSLTAYQTEKGDKHSYLHVPTYYFVEWLAQNWWSFLYEPRKNEREDFEQDFRSRHWLGTARSGFALPDVIFSPAGEKIEIAARPAFLRFAQLNFIEALTATVLTDNVRSEFSKFIEEVLAHLTEEGVTTSAAHQHWERVRNTTKEEEAYCRMVGALGISPYVSHPDVDKVFERVIGKISETMLTDLCDATNMGNVERAADAANGMSVALTSAKDIPVKRLVDAQKPRDAMPRAYEWGYQATDIARSALGIAHDDPHGSAVFFERLQFDTSASIEQGGAPENAAPSIISGAVQRNDDKMRVAIAGSNRAQRKFAAARAAFLGWSHESNSSRLVTTARTRDQQASRAFAAELLAPAKFLKKRLGDRSEVSPFILDKISEEIGVAPTVVRYQANNHGYYVPDAA